MKKRYLFIIVSLCAAAILGFSTSALSESQLVLAVDQAPSTMDPASTDSDADGQIHMNIFDALLQVTYDGKFLPSLAERYEHPDPETWKFYLRKGVRFHNGNPFTAEDVKYSYERFKDPEISRRLSTGNQFVSIDIIDDYTVVFKTKGFVPFVANNIPYTGTIIDKESSENRDTGEIGVKPIGTGPYKLVEWIKGSYLRFEANEDYWGGAPSIKTVEVRPITEDSTRFAALASGEVDLMQGVPVTLTKKIEENSDLQLITHPSKRSMFLAIGNKPGTPTADVRVRRAMYMAINEQEIVEKIMSGMAQASTQVEDPMVTGYNPAIKRLPYDPAASKKLLKEAGYENGFEITFSGPNDRYVQDENIAQAVARYLAKVGIKVNLDVKPKAVFYPKLRKGECEMFLLGWLNSAMDGWKSTSKLFMTGGDWNGTRYSDPTLDVLINAAPTITDLEKRTKLLEDLNYIAMVNKVAAIPLHYQMNTYALKKAKGLVFKPRSDHYFRFIEMSIK